MLRDPRRLPAGGGASFALVLAAWTCSTIASAPISAQSPPTTSIVVDGVALTADSTSGTDVYEVGEALGDRPGGGVNLMQELDDLQLATGDELLFSWDPGLQTDNVIAQVNGGEMSSVWGTIRTMAAGTNLFLLNPAGWLFGETSSVDVGGTFAVSSADTMSLDAGGGVLVDAFSGNVALATAVPAAFGFADATVGEIRVEGAVLESADGESFAFVGGDITIDDTGAAADGSVVSRGGAVSLVSVAGAGQVGIDADGMVDVPDDLPLGAIRIADADIFQFQEKLDVGTVAVGSASGGDLLLRASTLELDRAEVLAFAGLGDASIEPGDVIVRADEIVMRNGSVLGTEADNVQHGGDVSLAPASGDGDTSLLMSERSIVQADAYGTVGGDVSVTGFSDVELSGRSEIRSDAYNGGSTGNVTLDVGNLLLIERSEISSGAFETSNVSGLEPGTLRVTADSIEMHSGGSIESVTVNGGPGGDIVIDAGGILIEGAFIDDSPTDNLSQPSSISSTVVDYGFFQGAVAGDVAISADSIVLENGGRIAAESVSGGLGGNVLIETAALTISGVHPELGAVLDDLDVPDTGTSISVNLSRDADFARSAVAAGAIIPLDTDSNQPADNGAVAGSVTIQSLPGTQAQVVVTNGGLIAASSEGAGNAGSVTIDVGSFVVSGGADVTVQASGTSDAGSIDAHTISELVVDRSTITTEASGGSGGQIDLRSDGYLLVTRGTVETSVQQGAGGGGDLAMSAPLMALNGANIRANAVDGQGGNIQITANQLLQSLDSVLDASSETGVDGTVSFDAPDVTLEGGTVTLETSFIDASALVRPTCEAAMANADERSRFVVSKQPAQGDDPETLFAELGDVMPEAPAESIVVAANTRGAPTRGDLGRQLDTLRAAVDDANEAGDSQAEAEALARLGSAEVALGQRDEAIDTLERGVKIAVESGASDAALSMLTDLGNHHAAGDDLDAAIAAYQQSAQIADSLGRPGDAARAIANAGRAAVDAGETARARSLLAQARTRVATGDVEGRSAVELHLARSYERLGTPEDLGAAHDLLRDVGQRAQAAGDRPRLALALTQLGGLYEIEGRNQEALYLTRKALENADGPDAPAGLYRLHWQEARLLKALGRPEEAVLSYRRAVALLEETRQETLARHGSAETHFRRAIAPVYLELVDELMQLSEQRPATQAKGLLDEARQTVELLKAAELRDYFQDECIAELESKRTGLDSVSDTAAIVYPILLPDRVELLVSIGGRIGRTTAPVSSATVEERARTLRRELQKTRGDGYLKPAQDLYRWLVLPYRERLRDADVDTLVIVPDGALRSIPMGALHDGQRFLLQDFAMAVTPSLALVDPRPLDAAHARIVAAGVSEGVQGFPPLAGVREELRKVGEMYDTPVLLDGAFSAKSVATAIAEQRPTIVHIASHGVFSGDPESSFLLTHDDRLTMTELSDAVGVARFREEEALELLILSACETAAGDDRSALGLAGVAIKAGARSAMGSLWSISDDAAYRVVVKFHENLRSGKMSKARALQVAQIELLEDPALAHPFYWSPFLLISNWL